MRSERMSGLDEVQLDELEYRVAGLLEEPWDKGAGRPRELTLREALVVTCGYLRQNIIEDVWADIFDVDRVRLHQRYQILVETGYFGRCWSVLTYRRIPPWLISRLGRQPGCRASGAAGWAHPGCPGASAGRPPPRFFVASWTSTSGDGGRGRQHCTRSCRG